MYSFVGVKNDCHLFESRGILRQNVAVFAQTRLDYASRLKVGYADYSKRKLFGEPARYRRRKRESALPWLGFCCCARTIWKGKFDGIDISKQRLVDRHRFT